MKKLIIHVGCGKAGSTSIQRALLECREENRHLFTYPVIPNSPGNQVLRFAFCEVSDTPLNVKQRFSGDDKKLAYKAYQQEIKEAFIKECADANTVVLSSEFWFISSSEEVSDFKDFITSAGFEDVHIVMYLRDPARYYLSVAQQALKNQSRIPNYKNFRYDFVGAIESWMLLNPNSFQVVEFDRNKLFDGDIVTDFCNRLKFIGVDANLYLNKSLNETLSSEATQAIQNCYLFIDDNNLSPMEELSLKKRIKNLINEGGKGSKPKLKHSIESDIHLRYMNDISSVRERFGVFTDFVEPKDGVSLQDFKVNFFKDIVEDFDEEILVSLENEMRKGFLSEKEVYGMDKKALLGEIKKLREEFEEVKLQRKSINDKYIEVQMKLKEKSEELKKIK